MVHVCRQAEEVNQRQRRSLGQAAFASSLWLLVRSGNRQLANSLTFFALAAFMSPYEFGLGSIAVLVIQIARTSIDKGMRFAVIQRDEITSEARDTAWYLSLTAGLLLTMAIAACAPLFARVYGTPELQRLMLFAAPTLLFTGIYVVQEALIERDFRHWKMTIAQTIASLLAASVGISLAALHFGARAVVAATVAESAGLMVATLFLSPWRPGLRFNRVEAKEQIRFGIPLAISSTLANGNLRFAQLIVGLVAGAEATGLFRLAAQLNGLIAQTLSGPLIRVLLPAFSRSRSSPAVQYTRAMAVLSFVSLPAFIGAAAVAPYALPLAFGQRWASAGAISGFLCFAVFASLSLQILDPQLIAMGRTKTAAAMSLGSVLTGLAATSVGAYWGGAGAAIGFAGRGILTLPGSFFVARRITGARIRDQIEAISAFAAPAMVTYAAVRLALSVTVRGTRADWLWISLVVAGGALLYGLVVRFIVSRLAPEAYRPLKNMAPTVVAKWL